MRILPTLLIALAACSGDSEKGGLDLGQATDCSECSTDQICVVVFSDEKSVTCEDVPAECADDASCTDDECMIAMFESCPEDFINTGCSDTFPPTVISCNP